MPKRKGTSSSGSATGATRWEPQLSDLSVTEFLTLARMGFMPRGLVIGVSVWDAGRLEQPYGQTAEVLDIGIAMTAARSRAVRRLREQANAVGAEGVVGVRLTVEHHRWHGGHTVARVVAVGTAIAFDERRAPPEYHGSPSLRLQSGPFTSDLAGQDFVTLLRAGFRPVSIALGCSVYEIAKAPLRFLFTQGNIEIAEYTTAFQNARETAMQNLEAELERELKGIDRAIGVVGMTVSEVAHEGRRNLVEFTAVGTAVAALAQNDPRRSSSLPAPTVVVTLDR